ncbi:MAG TPA: hypothetical protein VKD22_02825, partial [Ramlibacter sp.]|nr:hypothetical protein [Ramlibacter sp.]
IAAFHLGYASTQLRQLELVGTALFAAVQTGNVTSLANCNSPRQSIAFAEAALLGRRTLPHRPR